MKNCSSCGKELADNSKFCSGCGNKQEALVEQSSSGVSSPASKPANNNSLIFFGGAVCLLIALMFWKAQNSKDAMRNRKQTSANATPIINNQANHSVSTSAESPQIKSDQQPTQRIRQYEKIFVSVARNQPSHTSKALISELNGKRVWKYGSLQQNQLSVTNDGEVLIGPFDNEDDAKKVQDSFYNTPYAQDILIVRK